MILFLWCESYCSTPILKHLGEEGYLGKWSRLVVKLSFRNRLLTANRSRQFLADPSRFSSDGNRGKKSNRRTQVAQGTIPSWAMEAALGFMMLINRLEEGGSSLVYYFLSNAICGQLRFYL